MSIEKGRQMAAFCFTRMLPLLADCDLTDPEIPDAFSSAIWRTAELPWL
jgi:hypothetical protein